MVSTRRARVVTADPSQERSTRRGTASATPPLETPAEARPKRTRGGQRKAAAASQPEPEVASQQTAPPAATPARLEQQTTARSVTTTAQTPSSKMTMTTTTTTTTTKRRGLRSQKTDSASPLRTLEQTEPPAKRTRRSKKELDATPAPAAPQSQPTQSENNHDAGIFFSKSEHQLSSVKTPAPHLFSSPLSSFHGSPSLDDYKFQVLVQENFQLKARVGELQAQCGAQGDEIFQLRARVASLEEETAELLDQNILLRQPSHQAHNQPPTNPTTADFDDAYTDMRPPTPPPSQPEFVRGSESALALLHTIENAAKESTRVSPPAQSDTEVDDDEPIVHKKAKRTPKSASKAQPEPQTTPPQSATTPTRGFFTSISSRFSAIKNIFGSSMSADAPPSPTPASRAPRPDTLAETLSLPPTPIGERSKRPNKKVKKRNPLLKLLTKDFAPEDSVRAEAWAKQAIADMANNATIGDKRKRLEVPITVGDLPYLPARMPWESGFGNPLDNMEDDDLAPAWAVYMSMITEEDVHKKKKVKTAQKSSGDDIISLNDSFDLGTNGLPAGLIDTNGNSAAENDLHPRRAIKPSPMFETTVSHKQGGNVFNELRGHDAAVNDREALKRELKQTMQTPKKASPPKTRDAVKPHNPSQGSFSVPEDSDSEDEEEQQPANKKSTPATADASPLWTQAPPPAPVPAHAPLPASPVTAAPVTAAPEVASPQLPDTPSHQPSEAGSQQTVDEITRQRQRLMKHTPHKPSRLQQVSYPSPSLMSDAGNESIMVATKYPELYSTMPPDPEPLHADDPELMAACEANTYSESFQQTLANMRAAWPSPIIHYESDEEDLSPVSQ
jgi:hypothetical protein